MDWHHGTRRIGAYGGLISPRENDLLGGNPCPGFSRTQKIYNSNDKVFLSDLAEKLEKSSILTQPNRACCAG